MYIPKYNDRLRVVSQGAGDPDGMGRVITLSELANQSGKVVYPFASQVSARHELGPQMLHLVLDELPVSVVSVTTGNGVGGTKLVQFPLARIRCIHACAELSVGVETEADFTDATPEGDLGIGTVAPANADALGTDATDDNWATAAAFTMSSFVDASVALPPEASSNFDGRSTAVSLFLNALVDAADIDNDVTTNLLVSGNIWITWLNGGGV